MFSDSSPTRSNRTTIMLVMASWGCDAKPLAAVNAEKTLAAALFAMPRVSAAPDGKRLVHDTAALRAVPHRRVPAHVVLVWTTIGRCDHRFNPGPVRCSSSPRGDCVAITSLIVPRSNATSQTVSLERPTTTPSPNSEC